MKLSVDKYCFVYKWTNRETNEYYIGVHKGNIDDGYVGSGKKFKHKYDSNPDKFKRDILVISDDYEYVLDIEKKLVTEDVVEEELCLNLKVGGEGGSPRWGSNKKRVNKHIERMHNLWSGNSWRERSINNMKSVWTDEYKEKRLQDGSVGFPQEKIDRKKAVETRRSGVGYSQNKGSKRSKETCELLSQKARNRERVECPHCGMKGAKPQMGRWHFNNCKEKMSCV